MTARRFRRFVVKRRFGVVEHGTDNVPTHGPVVLVASRVGMADVRLLGLFGPRPVKSLTPASARTCLRALADGHPVALVPEDDRDSGHPAGFDRGAAYLALVSGAPVVPVTILGTREAVDIVYGAPYRTAAHPWPRTKKLVEATSLDVRVHLLVALDAARSLITEGPR